MMNRLGCRAELAVPGARPPVQHLNMLGLGEPELVAQELAKEMVVAVPLALRVEGDKEEVRALELAQHEHRAGSVGDGVAEGGREPLEHGSMEQETPHLLGEAGQDLRAQVVDDMAVVAGKRLDELVRVCLAPDAERRKVETGRPSLRELAQPDDVPPVEVEPVQVVEKEVGFLVGEAKLLRVDLGELAPGA